MSQSRGLAAGTASRALCPFRSYSNEFGDGLTIITSSRSGSGSGESCESLATNLISTTKLIEPSRAERLAVQLSQKRLSSASVFSRPAVQIGHLGLLGGSGQRRARSGGKINYINRLTSWLLRAGPARRSIRPREELLAASRRKNVFISRLSIEIALAQTNLSRRLSSVSNRRRRAGRSSCAPLKSRHSGREFLALRWGRCKCFHFICVAIIISAR